MRFAVLSQGAHSFTGSSSGPLSPRYLDELPHFQCDDVLLQEML